ncbi:MAG: sigma 54-interacting transcriptional regulator [Desulfobacteraceae bacterium]|nr:sigma 54-interacting transcriptional regulator [Desulfobacteraceae bacterium]
MIDLNKAESSILIIDDEESLRLTFQMFLAKEGYGPVVTAATYDEALEIIDRQKLDLIISDIVLEGASGIDLLRHIKEAGRQCPVVMVTGYPNINTAADAVRLGAFDYLAKPVKKNDLLRVSRMALQQFTLWKEKERLHAEKERYRRYLETIFRSVRDAIITVDPESKIVEMNQTARDWTAHIPGFEVGRLLRELAGPAPSRIHGVGGVSPFFLGPIEGDGFAPACLRDVGEVLAKKQEVREHRVECRLDGGGDMVLRISAAPLVDKEGKFQGVVLVLRDVTRLESLEQQGRRAKFHRFIGGSPAMQAVYTMIEHVGQVDAAVLVTGESGTGKELVADALHAESPRRRRPLVKVDCSAIPEDLLESELFGHSKGAFTGAERDRKGHILQADGGTLFLDEIGDISPRMQLRLLRFLQEKTFYPVGKDTPVKVDVRVIAATNADLRKKVEAGLFREDLYFRLRVVDIHLPALRERDGDIALLARYFMDHFGRQLGKEIAGITDQALALLAGYRWPGNVRELEHVIERACVLSPGTITTDHLPKEILSDAEPAGSAPAANGGPEAPPENEAERILRILKQTDGNKAKAARLLGFDRSTLYRKLRSYDIGIEG